MAYDKAQVGSELVRTAVLFMWVQLAASRQPSSLLFIFFFSCWSVAAKGLSFKCTVGVQAYVPVKTTRC